MSRIPSYSAMLAYAHRSLRVRFYLPSALCRGQAGYPIVRRATSRMPFNQTVVLASSLRHQVLID
jgi:hypothetical protein